MFWWGLYLQEVQHRPQQHFRIVEKDQHAPIFHVWLICQSLYRPHAWWLQTGTDQALILFRLKIFSPPKNTSKKMIEFRAA